MIRRLRRWHRGAAMLMAVVLPAVILGALLEVRSFPATSALLVDVPTSGTRVRYRGLFPETGVAVEVGVDPRRPELAIVGLLPVRPLAMPSVVAYWGRPDQGVLIGTLVAGRWTRAAFPREGGGEQLLSLYSVALDSVLETTVLPPDRPDLP